jgi:hypothetical protein
MIGTALTVAAPDATAAEPWLAAAPLWFAACSECRELAPAKAGVTAQAATRARRMVRMVIGLSIYEQRSQDLETGHGIVNIFYEQRSHFYPSSAFE